MGSFQSRGCKTENEEEEGHEESSNYSNRNLVNNGAYSSSINLRDASGKLQKTKVFLSFQWCADVAKALRRRLSHFLTSFFKRQKKMENPILPLSNPVISNITEYPFFLKQTLLISSSPSDSSPRSESITRYIPPAVFSSSEEGDDLFYCKDILESNALFGQTYDSSAIVSVPSSSSFGAISYIHEEEPLINDTTTTHQAEEDPKRLRINESPATVASKSKRRRKKHNNNRQKIFNGVSEENISTTTTFLHRREDKAPKVRVSQCRSITHYNHRQKILIVGDGDFSFSACLAMAFGCASNMIATSLDTQSFLKKHYGKASSNIQKLKKLKCMVKHEIDATKIADDPFLGLLKFDRIIFNFPHAGFFKDLSRETQLRRHRRLVSLFLKNAKQLINEDGEIHISHKTNGFHVEWKIEVMASSHGLKLIDSVQFNLGDYPGYCTKYGFGGDDNFNCNPSKTFKFGLKIAI